MKKSIFGGLFLALVGIGMLGCKKTEVASATSNSTKPIGEKSINNAMRYSTDNRMLIFKTTEDYEAVIAEIGSGGEQAFIDEVVQLNYTSYAEELASKGGSTVDLIADDVMSAILNKDGVVQIGDYVYRINKSTEKVFVLPASKISAYDELVAESKTNPDVRKFSTSDEVIDLAESGAAGEQKGLFCSDRKANEHNQSSNVVKLMDSPLVDMYIKASYNKFGVYFTLKAEGKHPTVSWSLYKFYFQVENSSWAKRCGSSCDNYSHPWLTKSSGTQSNNVQTEKYLFFNGMRQLKNYHFKVRFRGENWLQPSGSNAYTTYFTEYVMIEDY